MSTSFYRNFRCRLMPSPRTPHAAYTPMRAVPPPRLPTSLLAVATPARSTPSPRRPHDVPTPPPRRLRAFSTPIHAAARQPLHVASTQSPRRPHAAPTPSSKFKLLPCRLHASTHCTQQQRTVHVPSSRLHTASTLPPTSPHVASTLSDAR